jgi:hypothetical protein
MSVKSQVRCRLLGAAGTLALAGLAGAQVVSQPMPGPTHSVFPSDGVNVPSPFMPGVELQPLDRPNHPPIDQIPPLPMPEGGPMPAPYNPNASTATTFHDIETGETYELPMNPNGSAGGFGQSPEGDFSGAYNLVEGEPFVGRNFGTMSLAGGLDTWPRSGNVKLVMRFVDDNNNDRWFVCSGSMQDPGDVL